MMKNTTLTASIGVLLGFGSAHAATINIGDLSGETAAHTNATSGTTIANSVYTTGPVDSTKDITFAWDMTLLKTSPTPSGTRRVIVDLGGGGIGTSVTWASGKIFIQTQDTGPNPDSQIGGDGTGSTVALEYTVTAADLNVPKEWVVSLDVDGASSTMNLFVDGSLIGSVGGVPVTDWAGGDDGGFFERNGTVLRENFASAGTAVGPTASEATASNFRLYNDTFVAVPEPSSTALLGLGGLALILRRRK